MSAAPPTAGPAPSLAFAARLLAATIAAAALVDLLLTWLRDRAQALTGSLTVLSDGGLLFSLLLAILGAFAAFLYARDTGARRARDLSFGTSSCLGLIAARQLGLLITLPGGAESPGRWSAFLHNGYLAGLALHTAALAMIVLAAAHQERQQRRPTPPWALAAGALLGLSFLLSSALHLFGLPRDPLAGVTLADAGMWIGHAASFTVALGLLVHAAGMHARDGAWARAARGLGLYRNATALRLLIFLVALLILLFARSALDLLDLLATLGLLTLISVILGLFQILGLVRLADAPAPRAALALALPLFALGLAGECLALAPVFHYVRSAGEYTDSLAHSGLLGLFAATQALRLLTTLTLLLALRALARARVTQALARRCTTLLAVLLAVIIAVAATYYLLPTSSLDRDSRENVLLFGGFALLVTALWMMVSYLRTITLLRRAMANHNAAAAIQR